MEKQQGKVVEFHHPHRASQTTQQIQHQDMLSSHEKVISPLPALANLAFGFYSPGQCLSPSVRTQTLIRAGNSKYRSR